jgi:hypothetical protein
MWTDLDFFELDSVHVDIVAPLLIVKYFLHFGHAVLLDIERSRVGALADDRS